MSILLKTEFGVSNEDRTHTGCSTDIRADHYTIDTIDIGGLYWDRTSRAIKTADLQSTASPLMLPTHLKLGSALENRTLLASG
ncbi:MAG: hypothetical protein RLZZ382_1964 [Bacteroidota bacterium]